MLALSSSIDISRIILLLRILSFDHAHLVSSSVLIKHQVVMFVVDDAVLVAFVAQSFAITLWPFIPGTLSSMTRVGHQLAFYPM